MIRLEGRPPNSTKFGEERGSS